MASAVPIQAGLLCVMSAPLPNAGGNAFRGQASPLPCQGLGVRTPRIQDFWILFLLTHSQALAYLSFPLHHKEMALSFPGPEGYG